MLAGMLFETSRHGAQLLPTDKNVGVLLRLGMDFSLKGEPTLIALDNGKPVGMILWGSLPNPLGMDTAYELCVGFGTFVEPSVRRKRVSCALRLAAQEIARKRGYDVVRGTAYSEEGEMSAVAAGFKPVGTEVEYRL